MNLSSKVMAALFAIFGFLNLILLIWWTWTYFTLKHLNAALQQINSGPSGGVPSHLVSIFNPSLIPLIVLTIVTIAAILTSIFLLLKNKWSRLTGLISSGLLIALMLYQFPLLIIQLPNLIMSTFAFVLLVVLFLNRG